LLEGHAGEHLAFSDLEIFLRIIFWDNRSASKIRQNLQLLLNLSQNTSWRVKDLAIQHLTRQIDLFELFDEEICPFFGLLFDNQIYVRISTVKFLSKIPIYRVFNTESNADDFWLFLIQEKEPLVIFESLCILSGFVEYAVYAESALLKLDQFMVTLSNHEDYYLRLVFIELLVTIIFKRSDLFSRFTLHFDRAISFLEDDSRMVRQKCLDFVSLIVESPPAFSDEVKRFVEVCCRVEIGEKRIRCDPEHIYQEVLEMDHSLMNEKEGHGEGNNVLFCYDC
jgi:hypothetical protein